MTDRKKVIKEFEAFVNGNCPSDSKHVCHIELMEAVLALLKEHEAQKFFVDESGKITSLPVVVRCKDCKWYKNYYCTNWNCPIGREPNWFCADGGRRTDNV